MKLNLYLIGCFAIVGSCLAQTQHVASPVDTRIAEARKQLAASQKSAASFNDLAFALIRKARDSRDVVLYREADKALDQSLKLSAENYDAQKLRVAVLLGMNEPAEALKLEKLLNKKVPDDIVGWSLLVDANIALGNYDDAEKAAQWIFDLRPGSSLGFEKAAQLRILFGDTEGALQFLDEANRRTSQSDADQKAWLLIQKAQLIRSSGNPRSAAEILIEALRLFPNSQQAAGEMAKADLAQGKNAEALSLLESRYQTVPNASNLYTWADALEQAGEAAKAAAGFKKFESLARTEKQHTTELDLVAYYSDRANEPEKALTIARDVAAGRHDASTLAAYAWALYKENQIPEAKAQMEKALAVGIRDVAYFCHAATIEKAAKDDAAADRFAKELTTMPSGACSVTPLVQSAREVKP